MYYLQGVLFRRFFPVGDFCGLLALQGRGAVADLLFRESDHDVFHHFQAVDRQILSGSSYLVLYLNLTNHAVRGTLERIRRKNREAALDTFSRHVYTNEVDMRRLNEPEGS